MFNYHTHTVLCGHAENTIEEMIESAIEKNFSTIGISEHCGGYWFGHCMKGKTRYFNKLDKLKEKYKDEIEVASGVELEWEELSHKVFVKEIKENNVDYILGSVHIMRGFNFTGDPKGYKKRTKEEMMDIIKLYLDMALYMINTGEISCLSHFDHFKRYFVLDDESILYPYYERIAEALRDTNTAIELNTHYFPGECDYVPDPELYILNKVKEFNIPIIISADAHRRKDVDYRFKDGFELLKKVGIKTTCRFRKLEIIPEEIKYV